MTRTQWLWAARGPRLLLTSRYSRYRYITCAIGNAPWPMGITGTGVHERQGRQHIRSDKIVSGTRLGHARPARLLLLLLTSRSASGDRHT